MIGPTRETPVLLWFRQDLRLSDQAALGAAVATGRPVLPVYVLDEASGGAWAPGGASRWWLHHSLAALAASLAARGAALVLRRGRWDEEIPRLAQETGATEVHAGRMHEPWARRAEAAVGKAVTLHLHRTSSLFDPEEIRSNSGRPFGVYTPFMRACRAAPPPPAPRPAPRRIQGAAAPRSDPLDDWRLLPTRPDWATGLRETWKPGESGAAARLHAFARCGLVRYHEQRNLPGLGTGTSMLSPHLHWGEISPAQVWHASGLAAENTGRGVEAFQNEVLWREFAAYTLWHAPHLPERPLREAFVRLPWRRGARAQHAWQRGQTGIPMVDAGMRQLWRIGWMHNRVRMIAGSFLVKHLLTSWRDGERWFWDTLVDADLASNSASWQWVTGCGIDSQPFFRVFNPVLQGRKFDPGGAYVRRWVPELARLPDAHIHAPWEAPAEVLDAAGVVLGRTYPAPIVDLGKGRARALDAYRDITVGAR
jgi:deoxyribodipyrimidine photo-lyase